MPMKKWERWLEGLAWKPAITEDNFQKLSLADRLARVRHSSSHLMAASLQCLLPATRFAIGPATKNGFFYDVKTEESIEESFLETLQEKMDAISASKNPFEVVAIPKNTAVEFFADLGQSYKLEILDRIDSPEVTLYRNGWFIDLCAGPHVPTTKHCRFARVLNLAATHWRGESKPSLTRISGTAWISGKSLKAYLRFLEEARNRDHRKLGTALDLFSFHEWAASALYHPKGVILRRQLETLWREIVAQYDYVEILNPLLYRKELFECSGHWDHFREDMFVITNEKNEPEFVLKPMNCPDTMLFFKSRGRSYRDLPLRVSEGQVLHRNESTGSLHGIMRARNFVQDDAHIFLTVEHMEQEISMLLDMIEKLYGVFGLDFRVMLSTRPEKYMGDLSVWDEAEASLRSALGHFGKEFSIGEGEGSFYGPKIDVQIVDSLGRDWQCGTIQLDFQLPRRFELKYTARDGSEKCPIVIHRAVFGSIERFLGVLIEHFAGAFPTWLAPVQAQILPVSDKHLEYAEQVLQKLHKSGVRAEISSDETLNYRIRRGQTGKIPFLLVVGDREVGDGTVSIRRYGEKRTSCMALDPLVADLEQRIRNRVLDVRVEPISKEFEELESDSDESQDY